MNRGHVAVLKDSCSEGITTLLTDAPNQAFQHAYVFADGRTYRRPQEFTQFLATSD